MAVFNFQMKNTISYHRYLKVYFHSYKLYYYNRLYFSILYGLNKVYIDMIYGFITSGYDSLTNVSIKHLYIVNN